MSKSPGYFMNKRLPGLTADKMFLFEGLNRSFQQATFQAVSRQLEKW